MFSRRKGLLALLVLALVLAWGGPARADIDTLTIGIGIDADTLNPQEQTTTLMAIMNDLLFDVPLFQDPDGKLHPHLISGYEISEDGLTWTLHARKGVKFHDGTPMTAKDLKAAVDRSLTGKRVPLRFAISMVKETVLKDEYTFELKLKYPFAPLADTLSLEVFCPISPKAMEKYGENVRNHPVGCGPYKLEEWVKGDRIVMVRNEDYWGQKATARKIIWKIVPETATREAMLRAGQLDICYKPSPANVEALKADPKVTVDMPLDTRTIFFALRTDKPMFKDKRVRQAFNYAIDKDAIVKKVLFDTAERMDGAVSPKIFGYQKMDHQYGYDPEKAKKLLKEAGWDFNQTVRIGTPNGRYLFDKQVSEATLAYLQDIGLKATLQVFDWPTYMSVVYKPLAQSSLDMVLLGWGPLIMDSDMALAGQFTCAVVPPGGLGSAFYCDKEYDKVIEQSRREQDQAKRKELLVKGSKMIWEDCPWVWMHVEKFVIAYSSKIKGLVVTPTEKFYPTYVTMSK